MKKIILLVCFALLGQALFAQATKTKVKKKKSKTTTETSTSNTGRQIASTMLTLHFISKGAGIDHDAYNKVVAYVNNHPKKPVFEETQQGREGEKKMTFTLVELTPEEQVAFVDGLQDQVGRQNDRILIDSKVKGNKVIGEPAGNLTTGQLSIPQGVQARVVVSFISKGAGIDHKGFETVTGYIDGYAKRPVYSVYNWGREGEKDYVLTLSELNADEQAAFVDGLKKLISSPDMVQLRENENYVKKGR